MWRKSTKPVDYQTAVRFMEKRAANITTQSDAEMVWLLEHPAMYTAGTSAKKHDLLHPHRFPVVTTSRGGQYTYHGPGQRVVYVMMNLKQRPPVDIRGFVSNLEQWIIVALAQFGVTGFTCKDRVGVWVKSPTVKSPTGVQREDKIAAIGIRLKHWVSLHGFSLNVHPNLEHFSGIIPCGIDGSVTADGEEKTPHLGVTSLAQLGVTASMKQVDTVLKEAFHQVFPT